MILGAWNKPKPRTDNVFVDVAEWYVGIMPRDAVEQAVEEGESGCFLIRQGKTDPNSFVLVRTMMSCDTTDVGADFQYESVERM